MRAKDVYEPARAEGVIAILRGVGAEVVVDIAEAFFAGGVRLLEVTCNTVGFADMIGRLREATAGRMMIGAGTVITKELCVQSVEAGAEYIVAPDVNAEVVSYCVDNDIAVFPGAATATEILTAVRLGARAVKLFPAAAIGAEYIRQLRGPIDDVDFYAVGGVRLDNIGEFISAGCVGIGIGGSIVRREVIEGRQWDKITGEAARYVRAVMEARA